jgi:hypothetical protein
MPVPYTFATATTSIPLSQLDSNFATAITIGNTAVQLGNTITTLNNITLANVTISSGTSNTTIANGSVTNAMLVNSNVVIGNTTIALGTTATSIGNLTLTNVTLSSLAATIPNNFLANSTATLGNTTITLGSTTGTVGNLALTNSLITEIRETATVSATAATGTINYDALTQVVLYYTTDASGNFTLNFRGSGTISLDSLMSTGQSLSATFLCTNGATAYYNSAVTVDGNSVTPKWQGGTAPTSGNASSIDAYTYVIIKTGSATFTVLASQTKFA